MPRSLARSVVLAASAALVAFALRPASAAAEHGDPYLETFPDVGEELDPDGSVFLLSNNGAVDWVGESCRFRYVTEAGSVEVRIVEEGADADAEGYGTSFRRLRARRRFAPGTTVRLEARCGDEEQFDSYVAGVPLVYRIAPRRAPRPPAVQVSAVTDDDCYDLPCYRAIVATSQPTLLLVRHRDRAAARAQLVWVDVAPDPNAYPTFVRVDGPTSSFSVVAVSRGGLRGPPATIVPRPIESFYVLAHDERPVPDEAADPGGAAGR